MWNRKPVKFFVNFSNHFYHNLVFNWERFKWLRRNKIRNLEQFFFVVAFSFEGVSKKFWAETFFWSSQFDRNVRNIKFSSRKWLRFSKDISANKKELVQATVSKSQGCCKSVLMVSTLYRWLWNHRFMPCFWKVLFTRSVHRFANVWCQNTRLDERGTLCRTLWGQVSYTTCEMTPILGQTKLSPSSPPGPKSNKNSWLG